MSILESFADAGALLTIASTHHGELKTLKYRYMTLVFIFGSLGISFKQRLVRGTDLFFLSY